MSVIENTLQVLEALGSAMPELVCLVKPHFTQSCKAPKPRSCHRSLCLDPEEKRGWSCDPTSHSSVLYLLCPELRMKGFIQTKLSFFDLLLNSDTKTCSPLKGLIHSGCIYGLHNWKPIVFRQTLISGSSHYFNESEQNPTFSRKVSV